MRKSHSQQPALHYLFELGVSLKFLNGLLEMVGGIFLFLSTPESLSKLAAKLLTNELLEDPKDLVANTLLHAAQRLSASAPVFASVYLLVHAPGWNGCLGASRRLLMPGPDLAAHCALGDVSTFSSFHPPRIVVAVQ
jgi:hypothetical protein